MDNCRRLSLEYGTIQTWDGADAQVPTVCISFQSPSHGGGEPATEGPMGGFSLLETLAHTARRKTQEKRKKLRRGRREERKKEGRESTTQGVSVPKKPQTLQIRTVSFSRLPTP